MRRTRRQKGGALGDGSILSGAIQGLYNPDLLKNLGAQVKECEANLAYAQNDKRAVTAQLQKVTQELVEVQKAHEAALKQQREPTERLTQKLAETEKMLQEKETLVAASKEQVARASAEVGKCQKELSVKAAVVGEATTSEDCESNLPLLYDLYKTFPAVESEIRRRSSSTPQDKKIADALNNMATAEHEDRCRTKLEELAPAIETFKTLYEANVATVRNIMQKLAMLEPLESPTFFVAGNALKPVEDYCVVFGSSWTAATDKTVNGAICLDEAFFQKSDLRIEESIVKPIETVCQELIGGFADLVQVSKKPLGGAPGRFKAFGPDPEKVILLEDHPEFKQLKAARMRSKSPGLENFLSEQLQSYKIDAPTFEFLENLVNRDAKREVKFGAKLKAIAPSLGYSTDAFPTTFPNLAALSTAKDRLDKLLDLVTAFLSEIKGSKLTKYQQTYQLYKAFYEFGPHDTQGNEPCFFSDLIRFFKLIDADSIPQPEREAFKKLVDSFPQDVVNRLKLILANKWDAPLIAKWKSRNNDVVSKDPFKIFLDFIDCYKKGLLSNPVEFGNRFFNPDEKNLYALPPSFLYSMLDRWGDVQKFVKRTEILSPAQSQEYTKALGRECTRQIHMYYEKNAPIELPSVDPSLFTDFPSFSAKIIISPTTDPADPGLFTPDGKHTIDNPDALKKGSKVFLLMKTNIQDRIEQTYGLYVDLMRKKEKKYKVEGKLSEAVKEADKQRSKDFILDFVLQKYPYLAFWEPKLTVKEEEEEEEEEWSPGGGGFNRKKKRKTKKRIPKRRKRQSMARIRG